MNYWYLLLAIFPVWATIGNILVIISVFKEKSLHNLTNYLVVNLAIADTAVAVFAMPFHIYVSVNGEWDLGNEFCDISLVIDSCTAVVSKFTLVAISVDRYIAVIKPLRYRSLQVDYRTVNRLVIIVFAIWLFTLSISVPFLFGLNSLPERISTICTIYNIRYSMIASVFTFWIPSLVLLFLYIRIVMTISARIKRLSKQTNSTGMSNTSPTVSTATITTTEGEVSQISGQVDRPVVGDKGLKRCEKQITITIAIVLMVFFICWAPFYGAMFVQFLQKKVYHKKCDYHRWYTIYLITGWFGYFNSCLNFIIYAFFNPQFKQSFKKHFMFWRK